MGVKNEDRAVQWQRWMIGEAEQPKALRVEGVYVSDMVEGDLPKLDDALETLDDM